MKILKFSILTAFIVAAFGLFDTFVYCKPALKPEPITDWKQVYDDCKNDKYPRIFIEGLFSENDDPVYVFLVDEDRWYRIAVITPRGCTDIKQEKTNHFTSLRSINKFYRIPGPETKFILVGSGKPTADKITITLAKKD